jgi:hypothetical protein
MLLLSFIPGNDFEEVVKIPAMLAHYEEHDDHASGTHLSFFDFLGLHYGQSEHRDAHEHQGLPFFSHQLAPALFLVSQFLPKLNPFEITAVLPNNYLPHVKGNWAFLPELLVFNPPRV